MGVGTGAQLAEPSPVPTPVPGVEEERQDLTAALGLVKELLSNVDRDVHELEKGARLQDIYHRMDPRAQAPVPGKGPFGREELLRRKLIHDGCLLWKTAAGRFKGPWSAGQAGQGAAVGSREGEVSALSPGPECGGVVSAAAQVWVLAFTSWGHPGTSVSTISHFLGPCVAGELPVLLRKAEKLQDRRTSSGP